MILAYRTDKPDIFKIYGGAAHEVAGLLHRNCGLERFGYVNMAVLEVSKKELESLNLAYEEKPEWRG